MILEVQNVDYDFYFQDNHSMVVQQTQLFYQQFLINNLKPEIKRSMKDIFNFEEMREDLFQEPIYNSQKTLCFDIQNVFITKVKPDKVAKCMVDNPDMFDSDEAQDYILVHKQTDDPNFEERDHPFETLQGMQKYKEKKQFLNEFMKSYVKFYGLNDFNSQPFASKVRKQDSICSKSKKTLYCCNMAKHKLKCLCGFTIYKVRPYVYGIMRVL